MFDELTKIRFDEYANSIGGTVEYSAGFGYLQVNIIGRVPFDEVPTFKEAYDLFGPGSIAVMAQPEYTGYWHVVICWRKR